MAGAALLFELIAKDGASPTFLRVASAADKASAATARAETSTRRAAVSMGRAGALLTKSFTLPLAAIAAVGTKNAIAFQKQMTLLRTAAGESDANMKTIASGIKKVSSDTATSLHELSDGMYVIGKAAKSRGWTGADQLIILKAAAQGAKAEMVPLATAADALTTVMTDYHAKASDAVEIENQLVVASGLAKTTFDQFSSSLSNVSPIASGLGISMKEILGSLATMTQHGVSPQQASENMRNLLFNLAGQNNVASAAMQQLGINTVDLTKNLSKRGLTGTLAIVDAALKKHTKDGMVVTDVHKSAALATKSLNEMLGDMGGKLKDNSTGLLKGSVGITDYTKYAKSLGGVAGAGALQFLALYKSSLGFSNQLKSGKGVVSTSLQQYQKSLGGMTSASVAMQIAGKYAADNAKNVAAVGAAAEETGKNVHGWALTQQTLSYKLQDASNKASLFAQTAGQKLLPVLGHVADFGTRVFKAFDGLSSSNKKLIGWSAVALASLGPILSISSRIGTSARGLSTFAGAAESTAVRVGASAQKISLALAGIGLVYAGTQTGGTAGHVMGTLGGGLTGAAIGSFFGPIGTAVGGVAGAVAGLGLSFLHSGNSAKKAGDVAKQALADQTAAADSLLTSLQSVNGAYTSQYRQSIVSKLGDGGDDSALSIASKAGLKLPTLVDSVLGKGGPRAVVAVSVALENAYAAGKITQPQLSKVQAVLAKLGPAATTAEKGLELQSKAMGTAVLPANQLGTSYAKLKTAFAGTGTALDTQTAAGIRNNAVVKQNLDRINANAAAAIKQKKPISDVAAAYETQTSALQGNLVKLGANRDDVRTLIQTYGKMPKKILTYLEKRGVLPADIQAIIDRLKSVPARVPTTLEVYTAKANAAIAHTRALLKAMDGMTVTAFVKATAQLGGVGTLSAPKHGGPNSAGGSRSWTANGKLPPGYSTVGERGWELVKTDPSGRSEVLSHHDSMKATGLPSVLPGFAGGTVNGTKYTTDLGYENAKARAAKSKAKANASTVSTSIGKVGQAYSAPFSVADVGVAGIQKQIRAATATLNEQIGRGLSRKTAAGFRKQIASLTKLANTQLGALRVKIKGSDLAAVRNGLKGTVDDTRAAFSQMLTDMSRSGASKGALALASSVGSRLINSQNKLASAKDYRSTVTGTLTGAFDPTQYGSVNDFLSGIGSATSTNKAYSSEVLSLRKKGLSAGLLNTLVAAGQSASLQSLSGASAGQIAQINKAYGGYTASVGAGGDAAVLEKYGQSISAMTSGQQALAAALAELATGLVAVSKRPVNLKEIHDDTDAQIEKAVRTLTRLAAHGRKKP